MAREIVSPAAARAAASRLPVIPGLAPLDLHDDDLAPATISAELLVVADSSNGIDYYRSIVAPLNELAAAYKVNTKRRLAHFLAQIGHESGFRATEENGSYSAARMHEIFGCKGGPQKYVKAADECQLGADGKPARLRSKLWTEAGSYAHNPPRLLSYVYASRFGNGDEASGDGFRYRGRGLIQLTFKDNYRAFTTAHNRVNPHDVQDFVANPDLLVTERKYALESAFFFWDTHHVNEIADSGDVAEVTIAVNGRLNGLPDREARFAKIRTALS